MEKPVLEKQRPKSDRNDDLRNATDPIDETTTSENRNGETSSVTTTVMTPQVDRTVRTRTHDRITLHLPIDHDASGVGESYLRGWRSPHGEPYRPLGNPNLGLKFTPGLHGRSQSSTTTAFKEDGGRREPTTTTVIKPTTKPSPPPHVLDMFPRNLRKRPPDDRQVKLAQRLQQSIAQYSPEKTRELRRVNSVTITRIGDDDRAIHTEEDGEDVHTALARLQAQHSSTASPPSPSSPATSPRFHVQHGDASFLMLRGAVQQGSARLQLVRNGQNFVGTIPSSEELMDLTELKQRYDHARERYLVDLDTRKKLGNGIHLGPPKNMNTDDGSDDDDTPELNHHHHHRHASTDGETRVYLPYTTREPHPSPHKPLLTLAEFKAKAREERMPMRTLVASRASMALQSDLPVSPPSPSSTPRKSTSPRMTKVSISPIERRGTPLSEALNPSGPKLSRIHSRRGSVVLAKRPSPVSVQVAETNRTVGYLDTESDALAHAVATLSPDSPSSPRVHSVVRLQTVVDSIETIKDIQAQSLAKTLIILDQDRRECLEAKYRNLRIDSQLEVDMERMRFDAESDRADTAVQNMASYRWYPDLLRHLISSRESSHILHPAELFCLDVIRGVATQGHAFRREQLYRLVLMLHPEDVAVVEVQQILTFLRHVLGVSSVDWTSFFQTHHLPEPIEIFKPSEESKLKEKKKQMRLAKIRSVVRINQVLRRLTAPNTQKHT